MLSPGDLVLVAVSGGPDSVAMLHALHTQADDLGITLHVAHLNHGIRGEASDLDEAFVRELAKSFGIQATVERVDVPAIAAAKHLGLEEAAREVRHEFLQRTADTIGARKIAVGHTADDRAESVLLNIIRGAGVDGLGSIRPVRGNIIRPLIDTWRSEIEAYVRENALPFRVDESNLDTTYTRNRVRHELLPMLERDYNPQARAALLRLTEIASNQSELIDQLTDRAIEQVTRGGGIDVGLFLDLPTALRFEVLRSEIERLKGDLVDVSFEQVARVIDALETGDDFTITLPSGLVYAIQKGRSFRITHRECVPGVERFEAQLAIPGVTRIPEIELTITAETLDSATVTKIDPDTLLIDADAVCGVLRVCNPLPGDRITPFGMTGTKKLQDVFVDKKVSRFDRARAAVVVDDERILWVVGVVASESVRVTEQTKSVIRLVAARD